MNPDPAFLGAAEASMRIQAGTLSVETLARACLARIAARDGHIRAWTYIDPAQILAQARQLDHGPYRGKLHGMPIGVKDVILTADMPTQQNSPLYQGCQPGIDANCIMTLRAAGALIFGKTDTAEFAANGRPPLTVNPFDATRTPGGSSSGSAAAVADFHVPLSLGTQTGGSTLRPASFCNIFAMKPSWGAVSREGLRLFSPSLDTLGWYGRSVADLALFADVFAITDDTPATPRALEQMRIAICRTPVWDKADTASQDTLLKAAETLTSAGADVTTLDLPAEFDDLPTLQDLVMRAEGRPAFLGEYRRFGEELHPDLRKIVENADGYTRHGLLAAYDVSAACRSLFDRLSTPFDAILTLSALGEAPVGLHSTGSGLVNRMWTLLHVPCVGLPVGRGPAGMPIGLTLVGGRFRDRAVLAAAETIAAVLSPPAGVARDAA